MSVWPQQRLDDVVVFLNNRRVPLKAADRAKRQGPYPYYGASGVVDHLDDYLFDGKYLLISEDGENLRSRSTPIAFRVEGRFWVNNHAHIVDEREPGVLDFLEYAFSAFDLHPYITGAAQPKLNKRTLQEIKLPIPPKRERLAINGILNALTDKIELNRRMNRTLEAMARALFRSWFVDFDPVHAKAEGRAPAHMDPATAALFPARLGDDGLPEGWRQSTVGAECNLTMGQSPPGDTYNDSGDGLPFFQGRTDFGFRYPDNRKYCSAPARIAEAEDTLVSVRAPVGDINRAWERCCIGSGVGAVRHRTGAASYTYYAVQSLQDDL